VGLTRETSISINSEIESPTTYKPLLRETNNHGPEEEEEEEQGSAWG
jgi:hypothetical protein